MEHLFNAAAIVRAFVVSFLCFFQRGSGDIPECHTNGSCQNASRPKNAEHVYYDQTGISPRARFYIESLT